MTKQPGGPIRLPATRAVHMACQHDVDMPIAAAERWSPIASATFICDSCYVRRLVRARGLRADVLAAGWPGVGGGTPQEDAEAAALWDGLFDWFAVLADFFAERVRIGEELLADPARQLRHARTRDMIADMRHRRATLVTILSRAHATRQILDIRGAIRRGVQSTLTCTFLTAEEDRQFWRRCGSSSQLGPFHAPVAYAGAPIPLGDQSSVPESEPGDSDGFAEIDWDGYLEARGEHRRSEVSAEDWWDHGSRLPAEFGEATTDEEIDAMVDAATAEVRGFVPGQYTRLTGGRAFLRQQRAQRGDAADP